MVVGLQGEVEGLWYGNDGCLGKLKQESPDERSSSSPTHSLNNCDDNLERSNYSSTVTQVVIDSR